MIFSLHFLPPFRLDAIALITRRSILTSFLSLKFDTRISQSSEGSGTSVNKWSSGHSWCMTFSMKLDLLDLRTAMIHYRSLFEELVQVPTPLKGGST